MFSHVTSDGIHVVVLLTPSNRVTMRLTHLQRIFSLDITATAWGQTILGVPVNKLRLAEDMAAIGKFWQAVNNHFVLVADGVYRIACPLTKGFRSRAVKLPGTREERAATQLLCCPDCQADVAIPDLDRSHYARSNMLTVPKWKRGLEEVLSHIDSPL
jgi:hypothetical protein